MRYMSNNSPVFTKIWNSSLVLERCFKNIIKEKPVSLNNICFYKIIICDCLLYSELEQQWEMLWWGIKFNFNHYHFSGWWRESECQCRVSSHSSMLHNLTLQERREGGRMLEEWLYLQPRGRRKMDEENGGWDTGAQWAEEKIEEKEVDGVKVERKKGR